MSNILKSSEILVNSGNKFMLKKRVALEHLEENHNRKILIYNQKSDDEHKKLLQEARKEAEKILADARSKANSIIDAAALETQKIKQKAKQDGFKEGFKEGIKKAEHLFTSEFHEIETLKKEIIEERQNLYHQFEQDLVDLALDIAKKVVYDSLEQDDEVLRNIIESTLRKVQGKARIKLRISTDDRQRIEDLKEAFMSKLQSIDDIEIIEDQQIGPGSCIIETENGVIDGGIQTRIDEIEMALSGG